MRCFIQLRQKVKGGWGQNRVVGGEINDSVVVEPKRRNEKGEEGMGGLPVALAVHWPRSSTRLMRAHSTNAARPDVTAVVFLADGAHVLGVAALTLAAA